MATQIVISFTAQATGGKTAATISNAIGGVAADRAWLLQYGLRLPVANDVMSVQGSAVTRTMTIFMGPSVAATVTGQIGAPAGEPAPLSGLTLTGAGVDYLAVPLLQITDPTGVGAGADGVATLGVVAFTTNGGGGGYSAQTTVTAVGGNLAPGGTQATFSVAIVNGAVVPTLLTGGGPYNSQPQLVVNDPTGAGSGAVFFSRLGLSGVALGNPGTAYSAVNVAVIDFFHTLYPDSCGLKTQAAVVAQFMRNIIEAQTGIQVVSSIPIAS